MRQAHRGFARAFGLASALSIGLFVGSAFVAHAVTTITTNAVSTDTLTVDTDTLTVDATNNRVGILTAAPAGSLQIGNAADTSAFKFGASGSQHHLVSNRDMALNAFDVDAVLNNSPLFYFRRNSTKFDETGFTDLVTITDQGRLGIGTTAPGESLEVNGGGLAVVKASAATMKIKSGATTPTNSSANLEFYNTGTSRQWSIINDLNSNGSNGLTFTKANSSAVLHLSQTGLVKVGGTDPSTSLDVGGDFAFRRMSSTDLTGTGTQNDVNFEATSRTSLAAWVPGSAADVTITGIANGYDGKVLHLINRSAANTMTLANDSGSSLAANRIFTGTGANLNVAAGAMVSLQYDYNFNGSGAHWRVVGAPSSVTQGATVAGSSGQVQFNNSGAFGATGKLHWNNTDADLIVSNAGAVTTAPQWLSHKPKISVIAGSASFLFPVIGVDSFSDATGVRNDYWPSLMLARSNSGSEGTFTNPVNNQTLGSIEFSGAVTSPFGRFTPSASILAATSENWSNTANGTYLGFWTTANTTSALTERMRINQDGTVQITNLASCAGVQTNASGLMSCTSDATLKDIHGDFTPGLDAVMNIHPKTYSWKEGTNLYDGGVLYHGFIAQDVQQALPEAVNTGASGKLQVGTTPILAASVNAIKEQQAEIDLLKAELCKHDSTYAWCN